MSSRKPANRNVAKRKPSEQMRRVYLRRRIVVGIAAVLVLALLAFCVYAAGKFVVSKVQGGDEGTSQTDRQGKSRTSKSGKSGSKGAKGSKTEARGKSGVKECGPNDIKLELATKSQTIAVGGSQDFTATIRYEGSSSCLVDASDSSRVLTITSGKDVIWRSDVCPVNQRELLMAKGDKDVQTIKWNADSTENSCQPDENLLRVKAGTYIGQLTLKDQPKVKSEKVPIVVESSGQQDSDGQ
jgi:hypothetical protein